MRVFAIDTSGAAVSAAVAEDGLLRASFWLGHGRTHAEALMPCIDAVLSGLGLEPDNFDAFAAISGPGSFTGLRIGISAIKAFAYANGARTAGVPTLDALAKNLADFPETLICPVIDARNGRVYQAIYRAVCPDGGGENGGENGGGEKICAGLARLAGAGLLGVADAAERVKNVMARESGIRQIIFNGDAAPGFFRYMENETALPPRRVASGPYLLQNASSAALLAYESAVKGALTPPEKLEPDYMNAGYMNKGPKV